MAVEKGRDLRPVHRRHRDLSGDSRELWSHVGVDVASTNPKARAVTGVVTGGAILGRYERRGAPMRKAGERRVRRELTEAESRTPALFFPAERGRGSRTRR